MEKPVFQLLEAVFI